MRQAKRPQSRRLRPLLIILCDGNYAPMEGARTIILLILILLLVGCHRRSANYSAECATPLSHWGTAEDGIGHLRPVIVISIDSRGRAKRVFKSYETHVSDAEIREFMAWANTANPQPHLVLEAVPSAPCSQVTVIRGLMDAAPICRGPHSLCSEGNNWKNWPLVGGP